MHRFPHTAGHYQVGCRPGHAGSESSPSLGHARVASRADHSHRMRQSSLIPIWRLTQVDDWARWIKGGSRRSIAACRQPSSILIQRARKYVIAELQVWS